MPRPIHRDKGKPRLFLTSLLHTHLHPLEFARRQYLPIFRLVLGGIPRLHRLGTKRRRAPPHKPIRPPQIPGRITCQIQIPLVYQHIHPFFQYIPNLRLHAHAQIVRQRKRCRYGAAEHLEGDVRGDVQGGAHGGGIEVAVQHGGGGVADAGEDAGSGDVEAVAAAGAGFGVVEGDYAGPADGEGGGADGLCQG